MFIGFVYFIITSVLQIWYKHFYTTMETEVLKKAKKPTPLHTKIRSALRLIFMYSQTRRDALKLSGGRCVSCGFRHKAKDLQVDHILALGPTPGSRNATPEHNWDIFIQRLFCGLDGLQVLCIKCHRKKTYSKKLGI